MKSLYLCVLVALVGLVPVSRAEPVAPSAAPAWKLVGLDGKAISSDQFKGKVVVIDFWATIVMGDDDVFRAFGGGESIPMTVIVDRSGNIRDRKVGAVPTAEYEKVVKSFL